MLAQRDEAHNAANRCCRGRIADTADRLRVFIGSGEAVHVSCATGSPDTGSSFDAAQRTSDATAAAIARALAGTGTPSTRVVGVPLTPRASACWVT
jgi:hypothetical protein